MFHTYNALLKKYPYRTNMVTTGVLFGLGDGLAQQLFPTEKEDGTPAKYDYLRTLRAWTYGTFFFSPIAVSWYAKTLPRLVNPLVLKKKRGVWSSTKINFVDNVYRVAVDQLIFPGLIWIPLYNVVLTTLAFEDHPLDLAYEKLQKNWWRVLTTGWMVWPAFQIVSFSLVPVHLRVVTSNIWSIGWNCFLSFIHNSKSHYSSKILEEIHEMDDSSINTIEM